MAAEHGRALTASGILKATNREIIHCPIELRADIIPVVYHGFQFAVRRGSFRPNGNSFTSPMENDSGFNHDDREQFRRGCVGVVVVVVVVVRSILANYGNCILDHSRN